MVSSGKTLDKRRGESGGASHPAEGTDASDASADESPGEAAAPLAPTAPAPQQGEHSDIRFLLDGEVICLDRLSPCRTVLEVLREDLARCGTKEGCGEGDCGACTVIVGELDASGERLLQRPVNACIQLAATLDGKQLVTVESLVGRDNTLHPVQRALVEHHGSQCGFCTPGFVMSLYGLYREDPRPTRRAVEVALAGNLCRCTGYRPILAAAQAMGAYPEPTGPQCPRAGTEEEVVAGLRALQRESALAMRTGTTSFHAPTSVVGVYAWLQRQPSATLVAGGTDVGLWITKQLRDLPHVLYLGRVHALRQVREVDGLLELGAGVPVSEAMERLALWYPELGPFFERFASPPIRSVATLGGNIANGSPIADSVPVLMALGASLLLGAGSATRELALDDFYTGYRENALRPDELLIAIRVPLPQPETTLRAYKVAKRFDQDISTVCGAFWLRQSGGRVSEVRLAYGGVAATVRRARTAEDVLRGAPWALPSVEAACEALVGAFEPLTDLRGSSAYRRLLARNLVLRFYLETSDQAGVQRPPGTEG